jgi:aconitate hydratase
VFAALHLGIRAVVARSFARIHRSNLIAQCIPPLVLADEADYERAAQGDEWLIEGLHDAVGDGTIEISAMIPDGEIRLRLEFTERERAVLLAGGLLAYTRAS